jgi:hypothetical protein
LADNKQQNFVPNNMFHLHNNNNNNNSKLQISWPT